MGQAALIGAGIGGLTSALRGKNILKGAALGGALGGVGSGVGSLMNGGSFLQGAGLNGLTGAAGDTLSQGAGGLLGATGAAGTGASLAPTIVTDGLVGSSLGETVGGANFMMPTQQLSGEIGMANAFDPLTGEVIKTAPNVDSMYSSMINNMPSGGGMFALNSGVAAPATFDTMFGGIKDFANQYGTMNNANGALAMYDRFQPQPMQSAPAGRIEVGKAPSPEGLAQFMQQYYPQYKQKRLDLSV